MKKAFSIIAVALLFNTSCFGQDIQTEALDSLDTAQDFVKSGNYSKAIEEINYALAKINEMTAAELLGYIPEAPTGFTLEKKSSQGIGAAASIAGNAGATAQYSSESGAIIKLNIAIGGMTGKMASLAALGSLLAGMSPDAEAPQSRQIRIKGYTGTETFKSGDRTGTLAFQIGEKTSVSIEGNDIASTDVLLSLAKSLDFAGIEKNF